MLGNSVTVINKSGKVVSNGKHLASVWKEAKAAYRSKKAEIKANRDAEFEEKRVRHALKNVSLSDEHLPRKASSQAGSHAPSRSGSTRHAHRSRPSGHRRHSLHPDLCPAALDRGYSDSRDINDAAYYHPSEPPSFEAPDRGLIRRNTTPPRPRSSSSYDEHLAYGTLPPPLPVRPSDTEVQLRGEMSKLTQLLDEANCLQYTATTMIEHLQKNPEALAAVGLTLAEISQLARKVGPKAFLSMRAAFPAVVALLASPQFLIAGGVAVGVTVVMLGGYKIVKRMKEKEKEQVDDVEELRELEGDLSSIELWRRGIADAECESVGTTVEGEFITPVASQRLLDEGVIQPENIKPPSSHRSKSERSHRRRAESVRTSGSSKSKKSHRSRRDKGHSDDESTTSKKTNKKKKGLSGLKLLFNSRSPS